MTRVLMAQTKKGIVKGVYLSLGILLLGAEPSNAQSPRATGTVVSWGSQVIPYVQPGTRYQGIAAGADHCLALKQDGKVVAWGYNVYGQSAVPTNLTGVMAIAAGERHSLVLKSNGTVVAWGDDSEGQSTVPTNLTGVIAIAAGQYRNLVLKSNGTVIAWGANYYGGGDVPANLTGIIAIAARGNHNLALKSDGTIVAWGYNPFGELTVPANLTNVTAVSAGGLHNLALKSDRTVVAWGNNTAGQLSVPTGLTDVIAIAAGVYHCLALKSDGTVVAWGSNYDNWGNSMGQCKVPGNLSRVVAIAAGDYYSVALKSDGTAVAWGDNRNGQSMVPGNFGFIAIAGGVYHSLALKSDGTVVAWGGNSFNQSTVPTNLDGVIGIAGGERHNLALKSDSTVVAWGADNSWGQITVPDNLRDVTSIAAQEYHNLALKSDGTVVAWGDTAWGMSTVPANLRGVNAIAAGYSHSLALRFDGTVVAWGYLYTVPGNLTNAIAIAAGSYHSLAVKSGGTVVAWGYNTDGQLAVPAGLSGVVCIAAGASHSLALKSDGTVVAWGWNGSRQCDVPSGLNGVVAIAANEYNSLALVAGAGNSGPLVLVQPINRTSQAGKTVMFSLAAVGTPPLNYQWRLNGQNILGATNATLTLKSVTAGNSGGYSVAVWNSYGSVVSDTACLSVLADAANGTSPIQIVPQVCPVPKPGVDSLVLITHGWQPPWSTLPLTLPSWVTDIEVAIRAKAPANWLVTNLTWLLAAYDVDPGMALNRGSVVGSVYGQALRLGAWQRVHLIGHSAGSAVIEEIARTLRQQPTPPVIQETFLDPYTGHFLERRHEYGENADWAENYFVTDLGTDYAGVLYGLFIQEPQLPFSTSGPLDWAHNVDVGGTLQASVPQIPVIYSGGIVSSTPAVTSQNPSHGSPADFYLDTIAGTAPGCAAGYGFPLSLERNGSASWPGYPHGNDPALPLCANLCVAQSQKPLRLDAGLDLSLLPSGMSGFGVNLFGGSGAGLSVTPGGIHPLDGPTPTGQPAWLALGVTTTNLVNFVQFDAAFTSTNTAQGLLTVYWNTNRIGLLDERVAATNLQTYRFPFPGKVPAGVYTLGFRLDTFSTNSASSSVTVTNVATGFIGVTNAISLNIALGMNGAPVLQLSAASGYNYLVQSSTNLLDWSPAALLVNTNGTVSFSDTTWTNSAARFYRAVLP